MSTPSPQPELSEEELELLHRCFDLARDGDDAALAAYLDAGIPVDLTNAAGDTLLILAAYHRGEAAVRLLLQRGADVGRTNDRGQNALAAAVVTRNATIVRALLAAGADPGGGDPSPVAVAAFFELPEMAELLRTPGPDRPSTSDWSGDAGA